MMMMFWTPEWMASSTPYWISGLSTRGSISLGMALVAGRKRVPKPAAGKTAFLTFAIIATILSVATLAALTSRRFFRLAQASLLVEHDDVYPAIPCAALFGFVSVP